MVIHDTSLKLPDKTGNYLIWDDFDEVWTDANFNFFSRDLLGVPSWSKDGCYLMVKYWSYPPCNPESEKFFISHELTDEMMNDCETDTKSKVQERLIFEMVGSLPSDELSKLFTLEICVPHELTPQEMGEYMLKGFDVCGLRDRKTSEMRLTYHPFGEV